MQQYPIQGKLALREGVLYGIGIVVINVIISYIAFLAKLPIGWLTFIIALAGLFVVGIMAAQKTARAATGTLAGLWAGLVGGLGLGIWSLIAVLALGQSAFQQGINMATAQQSSLNASQVQSIAVVTLIILGVVYAAVGLGIGAGLGALGGLVGRSRAKVPAMEYSESFYSGNPPQSPGNPV
jgi:hypothetical protein